MPGGRAFDLGDECSRGPVSVPPRSDELPETVWAVPDGAGLEVAAGLAGGLEFVGSALFSEFDSAVLAAAETSSVDSSGIRNFALQ